MHSPRSERIAEILGIPDRGGDEWTIRCLSPDHEDTKASASIYVGPPEARGGRQRVPGLWVCYSCGAHGRLGDAILDAQPTVDEMYAAWERELEELDFIPVIHPETWLDLFDYPGGVHPYWLSRFTEETAWRFRLGYDYETEAATIALRDNSGQVLGVIRRALLTAQLWKYRYPKGITITDYVFNSSGVDTSGVVVITEGATDAMAAEELGFPAVALYGSRPSIAQIKTLNRLYPSRYVTFFDNDPAGHRAALVLEEAMPIRPVSNHWLLAGSDLASLEPESRKKVLERACASR